MRWFPLVLDNLKLEPSIPYIRTFDLTHQAEIWCCGRPFSRFACELRCAMYTCFPITKHHYESVVVLIDYKFMTWSF
ncbi:hypothetical protein CISIN_1g042819mg [Citrus sinensis]|uniref:Uncharacterized protein n=1 Tax=Citrus sinensis TaxID=2711 RepID=A0A067GWN5_CITSI|nr:hypothetical protein CISIN_1g042819mg [Citrus sinensis]